MLIKVYILCFLYINVVPICGKDFVLCSNYHFYLEKESRHLIMMRFKNDLVADCKDLGKVYRFQYAVFNIMDKINPCLTTTDEDGIDSILKMCPSISDASLISTLVDAMPKFRYNIFPGTYWCGAGNIASDEDEVGVFESLDKCCQKHDSCPDSIVSKETKYDITNDKIGTISHCHCDEEFYYCLHDIGRISSNKVGFMFFNVLAMPCFRQDHPVISCIKKGGLMNSQCEEYEFDYAQKPKWQLFDAKVYYPHFTKWITTADREEVK